MSINPIFAAVIDDHGKIKMTQEDIFIHYLKSFKPGDRLKVIVKPFKAGDRIRSIKANAYYWGVVIDILHLEFGYEKEEMHDALGLMFRQSRDEFVPTIRSTTTMSSAEFWEYIERVRRWAAIEYNVTIPDPNKVEGAK
jgi:hypothetical protein